MATADERRAFLFLVALAAAGALVRVARAPGAPPGASRIAPDLPGEDIARQAERARRAELLARPLAPGERVDVDRASIEELERLPRVGRELARRIAEDREAHGPFGSLSALARVPGVGPVMLRSLERATSFSGVPRGRVPGGSLSGMQAASPACARPGRLALNRATLDELVCLPGIGPALADRIVKDRAAHGPFPSAEALERVRGVGRALSRRLAPLMAVP